MIPEQFRDSFRDNLDLEQLKLVDWYTDELFSLEAVDVFVIKAKYSRFFVDVERFADNDIEPMSNVGMGVLYVKDTKGDVIRNIGELESVFAHKEYQDHHYRLTDAVDDCLAINQECRIIDCHSFPEYPLPCDLNQGTPRPDICIGFEEYHADNVLIENLITNLSKINIFERELIIKTNDPYTGSIVPTKHYHKDRRVKSTMIEINRKLYMNEQTGSKLDTFEKFKSELIRAINNSIQ